MSRRPVVAIATVMVLTALIPSASLAAAPSPSATTVQNGLVMPWDVAFGPDGQMFVTERPGRVRVYAQRSPRRGAARHDRDRRRAGRGRGWRDGHRGRPPLRAEPAHLCLRVADVQRRVAEPGPAIPGPVRLEADLRPLHHPNRACARTRSTTAAPWRKARTTRSGSAWATPPSHGERRTRTG